MVALIKPQFEAPRRAGGRPTASSAIGLRRPGAVTAVLTWALTRRWRVGGVLRSPLRGPKGNLEWFVWLRTPSGVTGGAR